MKIFKNSIIIFIFFEIGGSCTKTNSSAGLASLNIINASIGIPSLYVYFTATDSAFYNQQAIIPFAGAAEYGIAPNSPLTVLSTSDTSKPLFSTTLSLRPGNLYSMYLAGQSPNIDTLLLQDMLASHPDSSAGARFINLSPGSLPVSINLQGNPPNQTEFSGLGYKQISTFKNYSGTNGITGYTFEVRDVASDSLLTTFTWNLALFKNNTLVICGSEDPANTTPISVFQVNNF